MENGGEAVGAEKPIFYIKMSLKIRTVLLLESERTNYRLGEMFAKSLSDEGLLPNI